MPEDTSSFGSRILGVIAEREPVSLPEIVEALSDFNRTSEALVNAYLCYGLSDQVKEAGSGKWTLEKMSSLEEELGTKTTPRAGDSVENQVDVGRIENVSQAQPEASASATNTLVEDFLRLLSGENDEPLGLAALATRLRDQGHDVTFSKVRDLYEELEDLLGSPSLPEEQSGRGGQAFSISENTYRLAERFRVASKLVLLLGANFPPSTVDELHQVLQQAGQDVSRSELEYVLEKVLDGIATSDAEERWHPQEDHDIDSSDTSAGQRSAERESSLTPDEFISDIEEWLDGSDQVIIPSAWITRHWAPESRDILTEAEARALSGFLQGFELGIEPDIRYNANPSQCQHVIIFRDEGSEDEDHPRFEAARLLLEFGSVVASADEQISDREERRIERHLEEALYLSSSERARLRAHLERRLNHPPEIEEIRERVHVLSEDDRRPLARFLITVAGADGIIRQEEATLLQKIYRFLDLGEGDFETDLREMSAPVEGREERLTTILEGEEKEAYEIPEQPERASSTGSEAGQETSEKPGGLQLDEERVGEIQSATKEVAEVLQEIFDEPEQERQSRGMRESELGANHVALISTLEKQSRWSRDEFERLAEEYDLMPGFAFERINDVAFDEAEEPLLEGNDPIELNSYALEALKA